MSRRISKRFDFNSNAQGNIRMHSRTFYGKTFRFWERYESWSGGLDWECRVSIWVENRPTVVYDFSTDVPDLPGGGIDWANTPTETISYTGWHTVKKFSSFRPS